MNTTFAASGCFHFALHPKLNPFPAVALPALTVAYFARPRAINGAYASSVHSCLITY